jgi:transcriptional regulator with XRE-family HTH domain
MGTVGTKIRSERKRKGLTLEELAAKVGITIVTLQRIETGKSSPSVALLSEIAQNLDTSIVSFVQELDKPLVHLKRENQQVISNGSLKVTVVAPRKMITNNISVTYGELKKGKTIDPHCNPGIEWAYVIEGKAEHKQNGQTCIQEAGDSTCYNANIEHSVTALEKLKFIAIYVRNTD